MPAPGGGKADGHRESQAHLPRPNLLKQAAPKAVEEAGQHIQGGGVRVGVLHAQLPHGYAGLHIRIFNACR